MAYYPDAYQHQDLSMPFFVQQDGFIISPYFDFLSYFFNKKMKYAAKDIVSLMIKLADTGNGTIEDKILVDEDNKRLKHASKLCTDILNKMDIHEEKIIYGLLNAGHPGGMVPLTEKEATSLHHYFLPENLYIADSSLFPKSLGNPPSLTIMALAKKVAKVCIEKFV
jgi:choline dehydrogenase-like flavoprotein